jgi:hypothetical protein
MLCFRPDKPDIEMLDLHEEFTAVLQALEAAGVPYALCGGLALMVYQRPRATVDIDLIAPPEAGPTCVAALEPLGFRAHPRPIRFSASRVEMLRFYKLDPAGPDVLTLDCLLTTHPIVAKAWQDRIQVPFADRTVSVVSIQGLIALKGLRGSPLDLLDIQSLQSLLNDRPREQCDADV